MGFGAILNQNKISTGGTTYTNEQILNPSDATLIGLTGNPIPADMFHTLATAGDLYVWRRTVSSLDGKPEVPAGYTLGEIETNVFISTATGSGNVGIQFSDTVTVSNNGVVSLSSPLSIGTSASNWTYSSKYDSLKGKYCKVTTTNATSEGGDVFFFPSDGMLRTDTNGLYATEYQKVVGTPYQPAVPPSTVTVDYPVSVNPNAYQTGSDAKPAGYTLGEVQSGTVLSDSSGGGYYYVRYSDSVSVSDDGTVSLGENVTTGNFSLTNDGFVSICNTNVVGKFCKFCKDGSAEPNEVYYIPKGAIFSNYASSLPYTLSVSRYQPVTGYPAIPAGTTIEYLGKLGGGSRCKAGEYTGTGTYGAGNPTTIQTGAKIKALMIVENGDAYTNNVFLINQGTSQVINSSGSVSCAVTVNEDSVELESTINAAGQQNYLGRTYSYSFWY